ncbi:hypothetical protein KGQ20_32950 [Catenulispora sp. NF23]|uniref:hypothetical protein n=1 Tax=Catenulispora pinistramenti TaxID=2705254 RepID=UPI001BA64E67|nr:hypothetical protein [Catenulispora pinistramenti]MBS2537571.1 hypothetical protein [Catenulispora pinistramenti]
MKSRIVSALAVLACAGALTACSGKGSAGTGGTTPAGAGVTATPTSGAAGASGVGRTDSQGVPDDPDGDLFSLDQQLSDINGALSSAESTETAGDGG